MNIILDILFEFLSKNKLYLFILFIINICTNSIYSNGISYLTANIINYMKEQKYENTLYFFYFFIAASILFILASYINQSIQNDILSKLRHWLRVQLADILFQKNYENFQDKNFLNMQIPITRISNVCFYAVEKLLVLFIPSITFLLVIYAYFCYTDIKMGAAFLLVNILIFVYIFIIYPVLFAKNSKYESQIIKNEGVLLELLNNVDTIISRAQVENEMADFKQLSTETIQTGKNYLNFINTQITLLALIVYIIIFMTIFYCMQKTKTGKMSIVVFITLFTIILFYREKMIMTIYQSVEFIDFLGKYNSVLINIADSSISSSAPSSIKPSPTTTTKLAFDSIVFKNISFKYENVDTYVFKNLSLELKLPSHKIVGIIGNSGKGKSTLIKLLLKMYPRYEGDIWIDGVNLKEINASYIRKSIIYINQNSKLFDRKIIENMLYGCPKSADTTCSTNLKKIMNNYPAILELFKDNNIYEGKTGTLGEKMSGGQRNVISIISGLVNDSIGLVLDEPTNGMDQKLKDDVIRMIQDFKQHKKFIVIITHDHDLYRIMDEKKEL
jgi:ABC-type multidrug transport system fused ATPase/permease subunit